MLHTKSFFGLFPVQLLGNFGKPGSLPTSLIKDLSQELTIDTMALISDSEEWAALVSHAAEMKDTHLRTLMQDASR